MGRWRYNHENGWDNMNWIDLVLERDRQTGCYDYGNEHSGSIK